MNKYLPYALLGFSFASWLCLGALFHSTREQAVDHHKRAGLRLFTSPHWFKHSENEPAEHCVTYPRGESKGQAMIALCESADSLEFIRGDERRRFPKEEIKRDLQQQVQIWLAETSFPLGGLCTAQAHLWVSIPESNPLGAQLRLEIANPHLPFVASLPWERNLWQINLDNVAILPEHAYPDSFGYRVASVLVKRRAGVTLSELTPYLRRFGLHSPQGISQTWYAYHSEPFGEGDALAELRADLSFSTYLEDATLNPIMEWIASRDRAFTFSWQCPP